MAFNTVINSPMKAVKYGIGFLTEDRKLTGLYSELSIKENIVITNLDKISKFSMILLSLFLSI